MHDDRRSTGRHACMIVSRGVLLLISYLSPNSLEAECIRTRRRGLEYAEAQLIKRLQDRNKQPGAALVRQHVDEEPVLPCPC